MRRYVLILIVLITASCHVGEEYQADSFITDNDVQKNLNIQPSKSPIDVHWYKSFKDTDLNTLLTHALNHNLSIQQAIERLQQSRYNLKIQSKNNYPMVDVSGNYDFNKASNNQDFAYDVNDFKIGADVSWELDIWGKGAYVTEQYYEFMKNYQFSLSDIKVSVVAEVINNYISLRETQEMLRITLNNLKLQKEIYNIVKQKHSVGLADDLALSQAEYVVETTTSGIPLLKQDIELYKNALAALLGVLPENLPVNLDTYKKNIISNHVPVKTKQLYTLPLSVVRNRPDIRAAEAQIKAQNAAVNEAITNLYPTLNLSATFGFISSSGHSLFNRDSQIYGYTPGLSLPVWHWGQLVNNVELQKHIKEEYILNYNDAMLTALTEIRNAITAVEQSQKNSIHKQNAYNKMRNIMMLTQTKYENGLVDFTDVATAEQNLLAAQKDMISSHADVLQNLTAFYKAVGGEY